MPNVIATSAAPTIPAVSATQTGGSATVAGGDALYGHSDFGFAVHAVSAATVGVLAESTAGRAIEAKSDTNFAIHAASRTFPGLRADSVQGRAIEGWGQSNDGVWGISQTATGVHGISTGSSTGVVGESKTGRGVHGTSTGDGVYGEGRRGVVGISPTFQGVYGKSVQNAGVVGESDQFPGIWGVSHSPTAAGTFGTNDHGGDGVLGDSPTGVGVHGRGGRLAGFFEGDVEVTGDIRLTNADCAEDFDIACEAAVEPGTVMALAPDGGLQPCAAAYDTRVVGVVSGAGLYKPGLVLDSRASNRLRQPIALMGKVYCKVDARGAAIAIGDLLTTAHMPGHAMKATDRAQATGALIGKAMAPLADGLGLIPILVNMR